MLAEHNTRITLPLMLGEDQRERAMIATERVKTFRDGKAALALFASFCPFCGSPYAEHLGVGPNCRPIGR